MIRCPESFRMGFCHLGFPGGSNSKESACSAGNTSLIRKMALRRKLLPTPVFLPREFHRHRSLAGYSPWSHRVEHN